MNEQTASAFTSEDIGMMELGNFLSNRAAPEEWYLDLRLGQLALPPKRYCGPDRH
jgi:hypothetical protein